MQKESSEKIVFYLSNHDKLSNVDKKNVVILYLSDWDDWFRFSTVYSVYYFDELGDKYYIGSTKIGQKNMRSRSPNLPTQFTKLDEIFFSLGQDDSFYKNLNNISEKIRDNVLEALNDFAYNDEIYEKYQDENVARISLMRDVSHVSVVGQFRRLANGNSELTKYNFKFIAPKHPKSISPNMEMSFSVEPKSNPPTNIHVIIGRNGVGKTHLFNNMIQSLLQPNALKYGFFQSIDRVKSDFFANLIAVSFSVFEDKTPIKEIRSRKEISYSYIGLKQENDSKSDVKSPTVLKNEFGKSILSCFASGKKNRWLRAVKVLETDLIFKDADISSISKIEHSKEINDVAKEIFLKLSSGHKIIILTITRLVETLEEKSLVILDEPETYLHPPLLSAFIRSLSSLLIERNAVAIIGTHSPVVLQEVPKSCIWKLRRKGIESISERLDIESFGENVGILTREVFGLEVTDSGFHNILRELIQHNENYNDAISYLNNQLGFEGKAILRNLFLEKTNEENR